MPRPTRSSDSSISRACCLVSAKSRPLPLKEGAAVLRPTISNLQLNGFGFCGGPVNCVRLRNQPKFCRVLEIQLQAEAVFRVERKVDIVAQIRFEGSLRQLHILRCFVADFA